ncbi:preprotein translocase subunit SecD [Halobaculum lipolyticum]|uniref:Protein-export membrane protein SecD n=1 Tax=Halobaculum lipolyticum TaxID=3032001 RepID=A0ABD5WG37_9EURY|nr:preprotein translocase subunit SecD [Halobaculum sp. DT31]
MSAWDTVKDNWRVVLLVAMLVLSTVFLFAPGIGGASGGATANGTANGSTGGPVAESGGITNLQYGLELSGGTRIRAPLAGVHASGVDFGGQNASAVEERVAGELSGIDVTDVTARPAGVYTQQDVTQETAVVEVASDNVTTDELAGALDAGGYAYGELHDGVSEVTLQQAVVVLRSKVNEAGLSGGSVRTVESGGQSFVLIEVPNEDRSEVVDLVDSRGTVQIVVYHPVQENDSTTYVNTTAIRQEQFQSVGTAQQDDTGSSFVSVSVREDAAPEVQRTFVDTQVAQPGGSECRFESNPQSTEPCILVVRDGQVVSSFGMDGGLANSMQTGEWANNPTFILTTGSGQQAFERAQEVSVDLRAGALPAPLALDEGTTTTVTASQGESFRTDSLIIGVLAVLTVAGVVFVRYGRPQVAAPMVVTALSEVVVLLGFAAFIRYPLDLSVIAGFIAVIGTGVDDLVIIADEVMSEGDVNSRRVFESRFRKAFWVIGAAAATTIIAMSPLAVLSLGDLQGFAIFTILGVLVGVLVTRPAYGDILRVLLTDR